MKPRVIVSVLDSLQAEKDAALTRALALAQWYESDLHVVCVHPSLRGRERHPSAIQRDAANHIAGVVDEAAVAGVTVVPAVLSGNPVRAIADYANSISADLVMVGRDTRRASGYWAAGSLATALGKAVKCPTIAVPDADSVRADTDPLFRNILVPVDFSAASVRALSAALQLVQQSGGRLRLLHALDGFLYQSVYSGARATRLTPELRARVTRANRALHSLIPADALNWSDIGVATVSGPPHDAIATAASEQGADLIVLGLSRRSRLEEIVSGSTTNRVLRRAAVPTLLVPGPSTADLVTRTAGRDVEAVADPGVPVWRIEEPS